VQWDAAIRDFRNRPFQHGLFLKKSVEKSTIPEKVAGIHSSMAGKASRNLIIVPFGVNWR
jgi:hypothetical protein